MLYKLGTGKLKKKMLLKSICENIQIIKNNTNIPLYKFNKLIYQRTIWN